MQMTLMSQQFDKMKIFIKYRAIGERILPTRSWIGTGESVVVSLERHPAEISPSPFAVALDETRLSFSQPGQGGSSCFFFLSRTDSRLGPWHWH
jgi:hypothetical protein